MRAVLRVALAATVLLAGAAAAGAELAILTNGHRYKVTEWEVQHPGQAVGAERIPSEPGGRRDGDPAADAGRAHRR